MKWRFIHFHARKEGGVKEWAVKWAQVVKNGCGFLQEHIEDVLSPKIITGTKSETSPIFQMTRAK